MSLAPICTVDPSLVQLSEEIAIARHQLWNTTLRPVMKAGKKLRQRKGSKTER